MVETILSMIIGFGLGFVIGDFIVKLIKLIHKIKRKGKH